MSGTLAQAPTFARRVLVIANETAESRVLLEALQLRAEGEQLQVLVVAPALNSRLQHWVSDHDGARNAAEERLERCLARLRDCGIEAHGWVGDADPLLAIEDALRFFPASEVVISTHPEERSNWLARNVVDRARNAFPLTVVHVVIDTARGEEYLLGVAA
jgi:GABA permease